MNQIARLTLASAILCTGCKTVSDAPRAETAPNTLSTVIERAAFNRIAQELAAPFYWASDANSNDQIDAAEIAVLWGVHSEGSEEWVSGGTFTPGFTQFLKKIEAVAAQGHSFEGIGTEEADRRRAVLKELAQGRATLVQSDFRDASAEDRQIVTQIMRASKLVEALHLKQLGADRMIHGLAEVEPASRMMFYRNQGPWCVAPATESDPTCNALPSKPARVSGLYPSEIQGQEGFCEQLAARPDQAELFDHFSVVRANDGKLYAEPYTVAYKAEMTEISQALQAAADAVQSEDETAFKTYLEALAASFLSNDWQPADEAWSKMSVHNSKWYLRLGPDEVYYEPCNQKAGFHVSFGRINRDSLEWQKKLDPLKNEMEQQLARLAGAPYEARSVSFHLPDFVDIVLNAGDSRSPMGATIGQSLPNWGPVANEGRGRTVAMTNFYTDPDSINAFKQQVESMLCGSAMKSFVSEPKPQIMSTVLHEIGHNLGPAHEYKVGGATDDEVFGGPVASMMEELKAQSIALYFAGWLKDRGVLTPTFVEQAHTRDMTWAFGHISRGMYTAAGKPKAYSQLAAIQLGFLTQEGAVQWKPSMMAANGQDRGCYELNHDRFGPATEKLMRKVAGIKARGDKAAATALQAAFVDMDGEQKERLETIRARWLRAPRASFVYSVRL